jgi:hypothetical protein
VKRSSWLWVLGGVALYLTSCHAAGKPAADAVVAFGCGAGLLLLLASLRRRR